MPEAPSACRAPARGRGRGRRDRRGEGLVHPPGYPLSAHGQSRIRSPRPPRARNRVGRRRAWDTLRWRQSLLSHAFLSRARGFGKRRLSTGWSPAPILIEDEGRLLAATPAYLKGHSQGEYVFDHGWADAWQRAGGQYYPKLQIAVPFTPVPGPRLLGHRPQQLLAAAEAVSSRTVFRPRTSPSSMKRALSNASGAAG